MAGSERQTWMVDQMGVGFDDRVLELGHGHGVAASAICAVLARGAGRYVGIDRSATMTAAAARPLRPHIDAGRAELLTAPVDAAELTGTFDLVVAIHFPPIDRGDPSSALAALGPHLRPGARLCVGFQPLDAGGVTLGVARLQRVLPPLGFEVADVRYGSPDGRAAAVVTARRSTDEVRQSGPSRL